jgi:hypothetical protein
MKVNGWKELNKLGKLPRNIPVNPYSVYKNEGWISADDFFGKDVSKYNRHKLGWAKFEEAKKIALQFRVEILKRVARIC